MISKEQGTDKAEGASEVMIFKIDVPANRFAMIRQALISDIDHIVQSTFDVALWLGDKLGTTVLKQSVLKRCTEITCVCPEQIT